MRILDPKKTSDSKPKVVKESGVFVSNTASTTTYKFEEVLSFEEVVEKTAEDRPDTSAIMENRAHEDQQKKEYQGVYAKGIYLLSMREHSVKEMEDKLSKKCPRIDLVRAVVDDLIERKYLSNSRFTEAYVRSRRTKGFGPTKIRSELLSKGIKASMSDDYLESGSAIWYKVAENQYHKKYRGEAINDYNTWTKRARFLQSRGFTMEHIHSTLKQPELD